MFKLKKKNRSIVITVQKLCSAQKRLTKTNKQTNKQTNKIVMLKRIPDWILNPWAADIQSIGKNQATSLHCE